MLLGTAFGPALAQGQKLAGENYVNHVGMAVENFDEAFAFYTQKMGFREAFPDLNFWGAADLIAEGDYVVGRWEGGGTHTGAAFADFLIGALPAASGRKMRFTGTTVLRVENGRIAEEVGLDDGVTALQQLGILRAA